MALFKILTMGFSTAKILLNNGLVGGLYNYAIVLFIEKFVDTGLTPCLLRSTCYEATRSTLTLIDKVLIVDLGVCLYIAVL